MNLNDVVVVTNNREYAVRDTPVLPVVVPYYARCTDDFLPTFKTMVVSCWQRAWDYAWHYREGLDLGLAGLKRGMLDVRVSYSTMGRLPNLDDLCLSAAERDFLSARGLNPITYYYTSGITIWDSFIWVRNKAGALIEERWAPVDPARPHRPTGATPITLLHMGVDFWEPL